MAVKKKTTSSKETKTTPTRTTRTRTRATTATPQTRRAAVNRQKAVANQGGLLDYFRFGESYTSLILGMIVVILVTVLLVSLFRTRPNPSDPQQGTSSTNTVMELDKDDIPSTQSANVTTSPVQSTPTQAANPTEAPTPTLVQPTQTQQAQGGQRTYTVKAGDDLWKIAEQQYKDGYKWVEIARANKLTNPGTINVGTKLVLPEIKATPTQTVAQQDDQKQSSPQSQSSNGKSYTVVKGDDLWNIAVKTYNNGYRWVDIARANNLVNPNVIHPGNKLTLPR